MIIKLKDSTRIHVDVKEDTDIEDFMDGLVYVQPECGGKLYFNKVDIRYILEDVDDEDVTIYEPPDKRPILPED